MTTHSSTLAWKIPWTKESHRLQSLGSQKVGHDWVTSLSLFSYYMVIEKAREFQENIYFCFIDYTKAFDCLDQNKMLKILKQMEIPDCLTYLLRNLYVRQGATVRTGYETTNWFKIGKGVWQAIYHCLAYVILCRIYYEKCQAGWITSWNQDQQEKYQQPQICRWYHSDGRK